MERTRDGFEDTLAATPSNETRITIAPDELSTAPTLIAGGGEAAGPATPSERYRLGDVLGWGGMGEVISARDQQIGRSVAIKRLRGETSDLAIRRFMREAKIQGRLDHPAIVPVHELCRDESGRPYFVMKQLMGTTLADVLAETAPEVARKFSRQSLLRAFIDVCLAVEFAHEHGVIHRDLKPSNIMLGDYGEVYVLDWGIARLIDEAAERQSVSEIETADASTVAGTVLGTPGYMSPEQIRAETALDRRADVYALGCILFELLARAPLYPRGTAGLAGALLGDADARPSRKAPDAEIAPELDELCVRATAAARDQRIATARELGERVQRYLDGDRDHALRCDLAREEIDRAHAALDRRDRREAMQAAGRALALDPRAPEPAQLVSRLMLDAPTEPPPEVEREIQQMGRTLYTRRVRGVHFAAAVFAVMFPVTYLIGIDDPWFLIAGPLLLVAIVAVGSIATRVPDHRPYFNVSFVLTCVLMGMTAHALSIFLIAPTLVTMLVALYSAEVRATIPAIIGGGIGAVLVPLGLELSGAISQTITFTGSTMVLDPGGTQIDATLAMVAMVVFVIGAIAASALLARMQAKDQMALQLRLHLQAWQLRQLVPQVELS